MPTVWLVAVIVAAAVFGLGWLMWWLNQPDSMGMSGMWVILSGSAAIGIIALTFVVQLIVWIVEWMRK